MIRRINRFVDNVFSFYNNFGLLGIIKAYAIYSQVGRKVFYTKSQIIKFRLKNRGGGAYL